MGLKANLIDLDSDGTSELIITVYYMNRYNYKIYKSDGSEVQGLWSDDSILVDYPTAFTEYSLKQYKNSETGNMAIIYIGQGRGVMPDFTYVMDAVMFPESLIAKGTMTNDNTAMNMNMTFYSDDTDVQTVSASRSLNETNNPIWGEWDNIDELQKQYDIYFGKYELVADDISNLNPIKINGSDSLYEYRFDELPVSASSEEFAEIISTMLS